MTETTQQASVEKTVNVILRGIHIGSAFTPGRYPFTYAYDFYRSHPEFFGESDGTLLSRGETSQRVKDYAERTGQDHTQVLIALADGYLGEWNIQASTTDRMAALKDKNITL
jgi:hypothetical protein